MQGEITIRPWGSFEQLTLNEKSTVKILKISKDKRLSKQLHRNRTEFWRVLTGRILAQLGEREIVLGPDQTLKIPAGTVHRITGLEDAAVLEISFGHFDEGDIVRIEDDHGRQDYASGTGNLTALSGWEGAN